MNHKPRPRSIDPRAGCLAKICSTLQFSRFRAILPHWRGPSILRREVARDRTRRGRCDAPERHPAQGLQGDALLVGGVQAGRGRSRRRAAQGARGHRRRRLCRALLRHRTRQLRHRCLRAGGRRTWRRSQHAQRRRRQWRSEHWQELHRQGAHAQSRGREGHPGVGPRRLQPDRDADRAREDRLLLGEEGPLRRRLDAHGLQVPGEPRHQPQLRRQLGRLYGAAKSASAKRWRPTITTAAWW